MTQELPEGTVTVLFMHLIASTSDGPAHTGAPGRADRPGEACLTFVHELIRQTLVSGLSMSRRRRLHVRVAEAMERACPRQSKLEKETPCP